jgi:DNA modification methylase
LKLLQGDCLEHLKTLPDNSIDLVLTDPPYGIKFMGRTWDYDVPKVEVWQECLRVLKPGGHLLAFAGTRTQHRMAVRIEDAGFEIRDMIAWVYSQGFPKATDVYKQLKKHCTCGIMEAYAEEEKIPRKQEAKCTLRPLRYADVSQAIYLTNEQRKILLEGLQEQSAPIENQTYWCSQLSEGGQEPRLEGWCNILQKEGQLYRCAICKMPREVFTNGEERWLHYGTQACGSHEHREATDESGSGTSQRPQPEQQLNREPCDFCKQFGTQALGTLGWKSALKPALEPITLARKPLEGTIAENVLKWGTGALNVDAARVETDESLQRPERRGLGQTGGWANYSQTPGMYGTPQGQGRFPANLIHDGSDEVLALFPETTQNGYRKNPSTNKTTWFGAKDGSHVEGERGYNDQGSAARFFYCAKASKSERGEANNHPTVKPIKLMEYLVKLASREGAVILDPYLGSGTTGIACRNLNRQFIGIELDPAYFEIARKRIEGIFQEVA